MKLNFNLQKIIKYILFISLSAILFLSSQEGMAFDIPSHNGYVTDNANLFTPEQEKYLEEKTQEIERETTAEVAILTVDSTYDTDIYDFTLKVFREWGIGKKDKNNGVFIVIAKNDHKWRIMTGYGVEGALPDSITKIIGENDLVVYFKKNEYFKGVSLALNDIEGMLKQDKDIVSKYQGIKKEQERLDAGSVLEHVVWVGIVFLIIFRFFVEFINFLFQRKVKNKKPYSRKIKLIISILGALFMGFSAFLYDNFVFHNEISLNIFSGIFYAVFVFILMLASFGGGGSSGGGGSNSSSSDWFGGSSSSDSGGWSSGGSFGGGSSGGGGSGGSW